MAAVKVEEQAGGDDDPLWNFALKVAGGDADKVRLAHRMYDWVGRQGGQLKNGTPPLCPFLQACPASEVFEACVG